MGNEQQEIHVPFKTLFKETFEGQESSGSWYTNSEPNCGLFGTIERINAREASMILSSSESSIAAHVHHTLYYLQVFSAQLLNEDRQIDWSLSWKIHEVDEGTWQAFKSQLREEYENLLTILDNLEWNELRMKQAAAGLAHSAYHLGSLRQIINQLD
ncbi:hypothetical protein [Alteribacter populi]|uniref:hypothetical protein n=1 Tax=Alteribacter populi TaxID=2011011 RepID=UPI000BBA7E3B|nr:hypothetical protein [Alteribacter populi]